jgi:hypothetical protein
MSELKLFAASYEESSIPKGKFLMLADSTASNGEPILHLEESSAKPMRSRGFNIFLLAEQIFYHQTNAQTYKYNFQKIAMRHFDPCLDICNHFSVFCPNHII